MQYHEEISVMTLFSRIKRDETDPPQSPVFKPLQSDISAIPLTPKKMTNIAPSSHKVKRPCIVKFPFMCRLKLIHEKKEGINVISPKQVSGLTQGISNSFDEIHIFDCRSKEKFRAGHIQSAINATDSDRVDNLLFNNLTDKNAFDCHRVVIVLYCGFSESSGFKMYRHIRAKDRKIQGMMNFPALYYPELYFMRGGYKEFAIHFPLLCTFPKKNFKVKSFISPCPISRRKRTKLTLSLESPMKRPKGAKRPPISPVPIKTLFPI